MSYGTVVTREGLVFEITDISLMNGKIVFRASSEEATAAMKFPTEGVEIRGIDGSNILESLDLKLDGGMRQVNPGDRINLEWHLDLHTKPGIERWILGARD